MPRNGPWRPQLHQNDLWRPTVAPQTNCNYELTIYKMGTWNGVMISGSDAPSGVYPYIINYMQPSSSSVQEIIGYIVLIR